MTTHECTRCGAEFDPTSTHTEIVRRDFLGDLNPPTVERLCETCRHTYLEEFLES